MESEHCGLPFPLKSEDPIQEKLDAESQIQWKLKHRFDFLPPNARQIELFSKEVHTKEGLYFEGWIKWEIWRKAWVYNPATNENEWRMVADEFSRELGLSEFNWVKEALK